MKTLSILFIFAINTNTNLSETNSTIIASLDPLQERCVTDPNTGQTVCFKIDIPRQG